MKTNEPILKLKELLNENVYRGNWNIYSVNILSSYYYYSFSVHSLGRRWFEYCYAQNCDFSCPFSGCQFYFGFVS